MSFTVAQRTREIGIRTALGANPTRLVRDILSRAFLQLGLGAVMGGAAVVMADGRASERLWFLAGVIGIVIGIGLLACVLPVRRALRVQPTDALRA
jgi:ABC-type antimicrobial peptide transport system permease subunit